MELIDEFKLEFTHRMIISFIVVLSASLYSFFVSPILKLFWIIIFLIVSWLFAYSFGKNLGTIVCDLIRNKKAEMPMPDEFIQLSKEMGVKIRKFSISYGLDNAYVTGRKSVVIGSKLIDKLTEKELLAVFAHELAHAKENHIRNNIIVYLFIVTLCWLYWGNLPPVMQMITVMAYVSITLIPFNWYFERRADKLASEFCNKEDLISALLKLTDEDSRDTASETHPSINFRINMLK